MSKLKTKIATILARFKTHRTTFFYAGVSIFLLVYLLASLVNNLYLSSDQAIAAALENEQRIIVDLEDGHILTQKDIKDIKSGKIPSYKVKKSTPVKIETPQPKSAQISVVISGLGLDKAITERAIKLPREFILSFSPYGVDSLVQSKAAMDAGHDISIDLPMQPSDPTIDGGTLVMKAENSDFRNTQNFQAALSKVYKPLYALTPHNEIFSKSNNFLTVMKAIGKSGLYLIYSSGQNPDIDLKATEASVEIFKPELTISGTALEITSKLEELEAEARKDGFAVVVIPASNESLSVIEDWRLSLKEKNIQILQSLQ